MEEELHLRYIESLMELGRNKQAQEHYEYISAHMYRELGVKPSVEMRRLYQLLTRRFNS
ncbi:MAG: BTAD domain-containing putative transcriptional regulator [Dethiobacteria bacterium]